MTDNQVIAEAMGLCWHDYRPHDSVPHVKVCKGCGVQGVDYNLPDKGNGNQPDFTQPEHYFKLMEWMREDRRWDKFRAFVEFDTKEQWNIGDWLRWTVEQQIALIAEWIKEWK